MKINSKIIIGIVFLAFIGVTVFILSQPSGFVKSMTDMEKIEADTLSDLATSVEIPVNSSSESTKANYIASLDSLYNATYNYKTALENNTYPDKYKAYVNAQIAYLNVQLLTINNTRQYYVTGDEFYANLVITTNKTIQPPHISDIK